MLGLKRGHLRVTNTRLAVIGFGIGLRYLLYYCFPLERLRPYIQIMTAENDYFSIEESFYLKRTNGDYYANKNILQPPFILWILDWLSVSRLLTFTVFVVLDLVLVFLISSPEIRERGCNSNNNNNNSKSKIGNLGNKGNISNKSNKSSISKKSKIREEEDREGELLFMLGFLSPMNIVSDLILNIKAISLLLTILFYYLLLRKRYIYSGLICGVLLFWKPTYLGLLLIPHFMLYHVHHFLYSHKPLKILLKWILAFLIGFSFSLLLSWLIQGQSFEFLYYSHYHLITNQDCTPNIGLRWYLFLETFDRYLQFFRFVFSVFPHILILPFYKLCADFLKAEPTEKKNGGTLFLSFILIAYYIYGNYPIILEIAPIFNIIIINRHKFKHFLLIWGLFCIYGIVAVFVMYDIWINKLSGNANHYYFQTIVLNISQILLFLSMLNSFKAVTELSAMKEYIKDKIIGEIIGIAAEKGIEGYGQIKIRKIPIKQPSPHKMQKYVS